MHYGNMSRVVTSLKEWPKVLEKLKLLNDKFNKLEVDVAIARNANSLFSSLLVNAERQYWVNAEYSSRETLETVG